MSKLDERFRFLLVDQRAPVMPPQPGACNSEVEYEGQMVFCRKPKGHDGVCATEVWKPSTLGWAPPKPSKAAKRKPSRTEGSP